MFTGNHLHPAARQVLVLLALSVSASQAWALIGITLSGNWTRSIGAADLTGGAGTNLPAEFESGSAVASIDIDGTASASDSWRIDVHKTDTLWPTPLTVSVKRTSDGSGAGSINGGTSYQQVTGSAQSFFSGAGDRTGADIQLKAGGLSIAIEPDTYSTSITYTIVDT